MAVGFNITEQLDLCVIMMGEVGMEGGCEGGIEGGTELSP